VHSKNKSILILIAIMVSPIILYQMYILLHELSHAFIAMFFGSKITSFSIFDAYVAYEHAPDFNMLYYPIIILAGSFIPTFLIILISLFYKYKENYAFLRILFGVFSLLVAYSNLQWIFGPFYYMLSVGRNPETYGSWNFDSYEFITHTGFSPLLVLLSAMVIFAIHIFVIWKKDILTITNTFWWHPKRSHVIYSVILLIIYRAYNILVYLRA